MRQEARVAIRHRVEEGGDDGQVECKAWSDFLWGWGIVWGSVIVIVGVAPLLDGREAVASLGLWAVLLSSTSRWWAIPYLCFALRSPLTSILVFPFGVVERGRALRWWKFMSKAMMGLAGIILLLVALVGM